MQPDVSGCAVCYDATGFHNIPYANFYDYARARTVTEYNHFRLQTRNSAFRWQLSNNLKTEDMLIP